MSPLSVGYYLFFIMHKKVNSRLREFVMSLRDFCKEDFKSRLSVKNFGVVNNTHTTNKTKKVISIFFRVHITWKQVY